jgi:hypothetical protein
LRFQGVAWAIDGQAASRTSRARATGKRLFGTEDPLYEPSVAQIAKRAGLDVARRTFAGVGRRGVADDPRVVVCFRQ